MGLAGKNRHGVAVGAGADRWKFHVVMRTLHDVKF